MAVGIDLKYTLEKDQILRAMKKSGYYKTTGLRLVIENVLLGVFMLYFALSYFFAGKNPFNLVMAGICLVFMVVILVVPHTDMAMKSAKQADGKELRMRVTPYKIMVNNGEQEWSIPLDGTSKCRIVDEKMIAIMTPEKQLVVLPISAIPRDRTAEIQSMIYDGTTAY